MFIYSNCFGSGLVIKYISQIVISGGQELGSLENQYLRQYWSKVKVKEKQGNWVITFISAMIADR